MARLRILWEPGLTPPNRKGASALSQETDFKDGWQLSDPDQAQSHRRRRAGLTGVLLEHRKRLASFSMIGATIFILGLAIQAVLTGMYRIEDQAHRAQARMPGARRRGRVLPERLPAVGGQSPLERRIRRRDQPGLLHHPQRVQLADRLDDPGHMSARLVTACPGFRGFMRLAE